MCFNGEKVCSQGVEKWSGSIRRVRRTPTVSLYWDWDWEKEHPWFGRVNEGIVTSKNIQSRVKARRRRDHSRSNNLFCFRNLSCAFRIIVINRDIENWTKILSGKRRILNCAKFWQCMDESWWLKEEWKSRHSGSDFSKFLL